MGSEQNNSEGWRNWGDHPLFVLLSAVGIIFGIFFAIFTYYKSNNLSTIENTGSEPNIENSQKNAPRSLTKDLVIGLYVNKGIPSSLSNNFSEKINTVFSELKPKKVGVILFGNNEQSIWSIIPNDFSFDWSEGYFTSSRASRTRTIINLIKYIETDGSYYVSKCTSINDLKTRITKDTYQYNIIITDFISSCNNNGKYDLELPSEKKVLILLMARSSTSDTDMFYYDEETLKKNFQTAKIFPFVSVDEKQLIEFLQTP